MNYVLVKASVDYGDEFDVEGFIVTTKANWEDDVVKVKKFFEKPDASVSHGFGTNEELQFEDFNRFENSITVTEITASEAELLQRLFEDYFDPAEDNKEVVDFAWGNGGYGINSVIGAAREDEDKG